MWEFAAVTDITTCWQHFSELPSSLSQESLRSRAPMFFLSSQKKDPKAEAAKHEELSSTIVCVILLVIHDKPATSLVTSSIAKGLQAPGIFSLVGDQRNANREYRAGTPQTYE